MDISRQKKIQSHFENLYRKNITPWKDHDEDVLLKIYFNELRTINADAHILDIGCGDGWISLMAAKQGFRVWGIDSSQTAIKRARKTAAKENLSDHVQFVVGDALNLPWDENKFDGLIDRGLLHHILPENRRSYLSNILRVLKKKALVYISAFSMHNPKDIGQRFTQEDIGELFSDHFVITDTSEDPHPSPYPAHLQHFILKRKEEKK